MTSLPYHPVVFTAKDDNTVGETISGSTGNPSGYYADPVLYIQNGALQLSNFRVLPEFSGKKSLVKTKGFWRAYSRGPSESVTHGDRRGRELWFGSPSPPLAGPREWHGAGLVLDVIGGVLLKCGHERYSVI